jgi:hypothetical protein
MGARRPWVQAREVRAQGSVRVRPSVLPSIATSSSSPPLRRSTPFLQQQSIAHAMLPPSSSAASLGPTSQSTTTAQSILQSEDSFHSAASHASSSFLRAGPQVAGTNGAGPPQQGSLSGLGIEVDNAAEMVSWPTFCPAPSQQCEDRSMFWWLSADDAGTRSDDAPACISSRYWPALGGSQN